MGRQEACDLLLVDANDKALAALRAATLKDVAATGSRHTGAEAVSAFTLDVARLKSSFRHDGLSRSTLAHDYSEKIGSLYVIYIKHHLA